MASITVRKVKGVWTGFYSDGSVKLPDGSRKQRRSAKGFPGASSREEAMDMARTHFVQKNWPLSRALDDYERHWTLSEGSVPSYRSVRRSLVEAYMDDVPVSRVDALAVTEWRDELQHEGFAPSYINKAMSFMSGAFTYFVNTYGLDSNPYRLVPKLKEAAQEAPVFDEHDFGRLEALLIASMRDDPDDLDGLRRRMTAFAAYTSLHFGLRVGECCALRIDDVSLARKEITVRHNVVGNNGPAHLGPPKGKRARKMSCADDGWLDQYARHREWLLRRRGTPVAKGEPLITFDGGWTRPGRVSEVFSDMRDDWGLPDTTHFHTLRHTHATYSLAVLKQDLSEVSRRLGHADVSTTARIYSHALPAQDAASAKSFGIMAAGMAREADIGW